MENKDYIIRHRNYKYEAAVLLSIVAAAVFFSLSTVRLDGQGLYYDEVFQAVASFAYVGQKPLSFAYLVVRGIPILNMSYVGAIKTAVYGLLLRISGASFSVVSWRLVGITFVCLGLILFGVILRKRLSFVSLACFFFLFLTDITVLLTTRFDFGPVDLALLLRLLIIAIWIDGELADDLKASNSFMVAALLGLSLFEKLSAVFLILPVLIMLWLSPRRRTMKHLGASIAGGVIGSMPLILANVYGLYKNGSLISLPAQGSYQFHEYSIAGFLLHVRNSLSLGAGEISQGFMLGRESPGFSIFEGILLSAILILMICTSYARLSSPFFRLSMTMHLCYAAAVMGTYLLPLPTWFHHWSVATPFQYTAIALFLLGWTKDDPLKNNSFVKFATVTLLTVFFVLRLSGLALVEQALARGETSMRWDPSLTKIGEFAAKKSNEAIFVVGDWGVANQMICLTNGKPGIVVTIDSEEGNIQRIVRMIEHAKKSELYIVFTEPPYFTSYEMRSWAVQQIEQALSSEWEAQPVEAEAKDLKSVSAYKFIKVKIKK